MDDAGKLTEAPNGATATTPLLLRPAQAAALCDTSLRTWRSWDVGGRIPQPVRMGRSLYWRLEELKAWVAAGCPDRVTWQTMQE